MGTRVDGNLYDFPAYYDLVFGSDWRAEFDFLLDCFEEHVSGAVKRVFEPASGTGRLLYRLAKEGFEVSGLDLNEGAVQYCNQRLQRHGFEPLAFVADMCDFRLPKKVDAAFNTINSFRHLATEQAALAHLRCMAGCLRKGGIYVLGLHLMPAVGEPLEEENWSARRGKLCINTQMWLVGRDKRTETYGMTFDVYTPTRHFQLVDEIDFRTYRKTEFDSLLAKIPDLRTAATYDFHYEIEHPIQVGPETEDVVYVLERI